MPQVYALILRRQSHSSVCVSGVNKEKRQMSKNDYQTKSSARNSRQSGVGDGLGAGVAVVVTATGPIFSSSPSSVPFTFL